MPDFKLIHKVYLPIGPGLQGAVYAVAFSPDGKTLVATGYTGSWEGDNGPWCFYLIDVAKGEIKRSICDLPHRVNHVAFSPDGRYLAFALKDGNGMRVYRTTDYTLVADRRDCPKTSTWVEFDRSGRVINTCYDGALRLYDRQFKLIATRFMPEGRRPDSATFSPDGRKIAVGYDEPGGDDPRWAPAVEVISGANLSHLSWPNVTGVDNGALWRVAWSVDGKTLYATGSWRRGDRYPVRRWSNDGRGRPQDSAGSASLNYRLLSLPEGRFLFASELPYVALADSRGQLVAEKRIPIADYSDIADKLRVSRDGYSIQFAFEASGREPAFLALQRAWLTRGPAPKDVELFPHLTEMPGLLVRGWSRGNQPTLNGQPLKKTRPTEQFMSLAFADGKSFVLGTIWNVIRYNAAGEILWATPVPFGARGVVVTPDGRLVVAAISDGTIRWYAMDTGKELLAFFPHRDGRRWVAWTPKGYFTASADGEDLVGWTVSRGREKAADFFPLSKFRDTFYRPDIISRVLAGLSEETAIKAANLAIRKPRADEDITKRQLPVVRIVHPAAQSSWVTGDEVTVKFAVRSPSGLAIKRVFARLDGQDVEGAETTVEAAAPDQEVNGLLTVRIPHDVKLSLLAETELSTSVEQYINLKKVGGSRPPNRNLYALVVGVGRYVKNPLGAFPANDADNIGAKLMAQGGSGRPFKGAFTKVLKDSEATYERIRTELRWLRDQAENTYDVALFYFSGHGAREGAESFLLPVDYDGDPDKTGIDKRWVLQVLEKVNGRVVIVIDACHAADGLDAAGFVNAVKAKAKAIGAFASSMSGRASYGRESEATPGNSYFTQAMLEKLEESGRITLLDMQYWLDQRVEPLSRGKQIPEVWVHPEIKQMQIAGP